MTALNTTLWFLSSPTYVNRLIARAAKFAMIMQYYGVKKGQTVAVKR